MTSLTERYRPPRISAVWRAPIAKHRHLTLETISGLGNLSTRFLSEFERGKETAEIGKVLKALHTLGLEVVIQPRGSVSRIPPGNTDGETS